MVLIHKGEFERARWRERKMIERREKIGIKERKNKKQKERANQRERDRDKENDLERAKREREFIYDNKEFITKLYQRSE